MKFDSMDIVKAMQIIAESNNSKLKLDKTITAQILSVENVETGEYRVKYEGNSFLAYSYDIKTTFKPEENVYVKIPENDMSKRKIIEGRVSSLGNTLTNILEQQVEVNLIEPSLDKFYGYDKSKTWGIVAGVGESHPYFMQTIYQAPSDAQGDYFFQNYIRKYNKVKISGSFSTNFMGQHNKGNYGLIVTFKTSNGEKISYRLDFSNFVGDPYRYTSPSPQSVIIDLFEQSVLGLDSILLFQENFETDKSLNYSQEVIYENKGEDDPVVCNIFVKDIDISFCEVIDLKNTSYYLTIATPLGSMFIGDTTSITLDARLKFQGSNILSSSTCKCYWYKENLSIKKGDDKYDKLAGVRWEKINKEQEDYLPKILVDSKDVKNHAKYKLVVIYKDDITLSKEVEVFQYNPSHNVYIKQSTRNSSRIVLEILSKKENDNRVYFGDWYFLLPDGSYDLIPSGENVSFVDVTDYLIYPTATFFCQVYYNNEPICIETHNFSISDSQNDLILTYIGQDIYQYNANGDVAYEDTELDRTLGIEVEWKDGFGSAYSVTYLAPDGTELQNDRTKAHSPTNSMMQNLWVDSTSILHYNISQKYNLNRNNNVITIKITCTSNGNEYLFYKEILFLKDGDQGTNGTTYICAIRPVDINTQLKLNGVHALRYNRGWLSGGLNLRCFVYKNGTLINNNPDFKLEYEWECGSQFADKTDKLRINTINSQSDYRNIQGIGTLDTKGDYVLKVTIKVRELSNSETTQIYCQYPVDIAVGGLDTQYIDMNLPSYIKYTSSGINAAFLNQELRCTYRGTDLPIYPTNTSILNVKDGKLDPVQKFQYANGIAALRCEVSSTMYLLHPVMMYLDTYGNEAINGWDGTKLELDEDGKYILAPQIGAGKKNPDNTFTGVVMGLDTAQDKIGLYGYRYGIAQFGFKEDGTAFIGAAGKGQILFDGNKGTITSGNYTSTTGMKIDLQNGHIDAYNFKISSGNMLLDSANQKFDFTVGSSNNSRFLITHKNGNRLFYIGQDNYYLQSQDYVSEKQGTKFDLTKGRIESWNFTLRSSCLTINSENNRFEFDTAGDIGKNGAFVIKGKDEQGTSKTLMNISSNYYYLQSANYNGGTGDNLRGVYINLQTGQFKVGGNAEFNGTIRANSGTIGGWTINKNGLGNDSVYLNSNGSARFGENCSISAGGTLSATNASISGTIRADAGYIGAWQIDNRALTCGSTTLSTDGTILTSLLSASGGTIGGWIISSTGLSSVTGNVALRSNSNQPIHTTFGDIGLVIGSMPGRPTYNFGLDSTNGAGDQSIVLNAGSNIALRCVNNGSIYVNGSACYFGSTKIEADSFKADSISGDSLSITNLISGGSLKITGSVDFSGATQTGIRARFA